ncbi:TIGR04140 family protein [Thermococcus sp.]|uniref:TIGR04140 family protein n=1 Tax=Thermococcus sp. TaxID=35749 RepID=UPI00262E3670|nr:TIGR04140 family protein [Thermococcus sp.]
MRVVETPVPIEELEEIRERKRIVVELVLLKKIERNGIPLNRVLIRGNPREIERFMEFLRRSRAGG